jgi:hypothetical protein
VSKLDQLIAKPVAQGRILYMTDRFKVSQGYEPAFTRMLSACGIRRQQVTTSDVYSMVPDAMYKKGNETLWRFNPAKTKMVEEAFRVRINAIKPKLIVVSDAAVLGVLVGGDSKLGTLDKCRGGVYYYEGIPCVVTLPITVIHTHVDQRLLEGIDDDNKEQPYRIPSGAWILHRDWQKVGRYFHGKAKRLPPFQYSVCRTIQDCYAARDFLSACVAIATDIETGCYPPQITCVGYTGLLADGRVRSFVIPFYDTTQQDGCFWESPEDHALAYSIMGEINDSPSVKMMQNGHYDCSYFIRDRVPTKNFLVDTMLMWHAMYPELPKSLDFISSILLDEFQYWKDDIKGIDDKDQTNQGMEKYWRYNALDCFNTLFNGFVLCQLLATSDTLPTNYQDSFMRFLSGMQMSMRGVKADFNRRNYHRANLEAQREDALARLKYIIADPDFNINSPAHKASLLYDVFGVRERTARGRYVDRSKPLKGGNAVSAGAIPLKLVKTEHPLFKYIIEVMESAMEPDKQISNVCNMFLATDRFRTCFSAAGTETTRYGSKKSNFWDGGNAQNIRKDYRDWFVADSHCIFMEVDYSQSDDVFIGYESNDPAKIEVIQSGRDGHAVHGELFFKLPYESIVAGKKAGDPVIVHPTTGIRQLSKRVVHGTNFQMAALTLYMTMGRDSVVQAAVLLGHKDAEAWPQERLVQVCGFLMLVYRKKYTRLTNREWYGEIAKLLKSKGVIVNAFGISRRFLGNPEDSGTQREATAFYGQSDTAGNMNRVMYEIDWGYIQKNFRDGPNPSYGDKPRKMSWRDYGFRFMLQVHDSFLIQLDTRNPRWTEAAFNVLHVMKRPVIINGHSVSIKTEQEFGVRWGKEMNQPWNGTSESDLHRIASELLPHYQH